MLEVALAAIAVGWCVMRFVGLDHVPAGLSTDEALSGLHVQCLAETGKSADGQRWPMFATGVAGGLYSPTYLYTLLVWTRVFGTSIVSLRGMSAAFSILAIAGVGLLARRLAGPRAAGLSMVAAALSPWSFQVSRLAVDAPMAPALVVWGVYLFLRSPRAVWAAASGAVLTLAAYTYSPVRVQVVLLTLLLFVVERERLRPKRVLAYVGAVAVVGLPLTVRILDGTVLERARTLSIFTDDYVEAHRGHLSRTAFFVKQTLDNLYEHLRPSYLFFTGDSNLRHSTQVMGELGWLDILAVVFFAVALGVLVARAFRPAWQRDQPPSRAWLVAGAAAVAGMFGILPAALCWEGLPHALRSMAAWPSVSLFSGVTLSAVWPRSRLVAALALALAAGQSAHFVNNYFDAYAKESFGAWEGELRAAAAAHDEARFAREARRFTDLEFRYYLIRNFGETCASSRARAEKILKGN